VFEKWVKVYPVKLTLQYYFWRSVKEQFIVKVLKLDFYQNSIIKKGQYINCAHKMIKLLANEHLLKPFIDYMHSF